VLKNELIEISVANSFKNTGISNSLSISRCYFLAYNT